MADAHAIPRGAIKVLAVASAVSSLLVAACGGGSGDGSSSGATAEGLWLGPSNTSRTITALVLDDATFYVFYSASGNPAVIAGVVQGSGNSDNGNFSSTNVRDFNVEASNLLAPTFSATYLPRQSLKGTITYTPGGAVTFPATFNASYDSTPSLAALAGTFTGRAAALQSAENATVAINSAGTISGSGTSGCTVSGTITPRARGNVFNVSLTFGAAPCILANQTTTGAAYFDSGTKRLLVATPNAARTDAVLFVGTKP